MIQPITVTGGQALVKTLEAHLIEHAFCLAGESFLPTISALQESEQIRTITSRLELEAGFAALAQAQLTHKPGIAFVTRGPGATNASIAVYTAQQSSVPMVLFVGQVSTQYLPYESTQKIDIDGMFRSICKEVFTPRSVQEIVDHTVSAMAVAISGRPGPVVIDLPLDLQQKTAEVSIPAPIMPALSTPHEETVASIRDEIAFASKPLIVAGERLGFEGASPLLLHVAETLGMGILTTFRRQDLCPFDHPNYIGNLGLSHEPHVKQAWEEADLILMAGHRLTQETTDHYDPKRMSGKTLITVYPDPDVVTHPLYPVDIAIVANIAPTLQSLLIQGFCSISEDQKAWVDEAHKAQMESMKRPLNVSQSECDMAAIMEIVNDIAHEGSIIVTDAGNFATWPQTMYQFRHPSTQLGPVNGAMGFGAPAAIGAKLCRPNQAVIAFAGDGGFMMTGFPALATAAQEDIPVKIIVCDNSYYGTIYMHQVKNGSEENHTLALQNPDFAKMAEGYAGVKAWTVNKTAEFEQAFQEALVHPGPALLHVKTNIDDIIAGKRLSEMVTGNG